MANFSERIKDLRKRNNFSQQRLADLINVNKQTISQYERNVRFPTKENLEALCDIFNVSTDYLLGREDVSPLLLSSDELELIDKYRSNPAAITDSSDLMEKTLISNYRKLSDDGRKDLVKRSDELVQLESLRKESRLGKDA